MESLKYWNYDGFEIASYKWKLEERKNKKIFGNGSDKNKCVYTFNELGFRGDSFKKEGTKILSVGCSHTEGIEVNDTETWSHILSRKITNGVDLNFGLSGRSNDYICRTILSWTEYVNPNIVLIMYTYPHRREYYNETGGVEPYHPSAWGYFSEDVKGKTDWKNISQLSNENEDFINWYKNHLLITYFLKSKNIPFVWNGTFLNTDYTDGNRFDGNYPNFLDNHSHASYTDNKKYADNLYEFLEKRNFSLND
jgi:hypothetical protein